MSATSLPSVPVPLDEHFTVGVSFAEPVLISLQGELDSLPSSQLALIVGAVLEAGHRSVALDLSACGFIGAAGLRVITSTAGRLEAGGVV